MTPEEIVESWIESQSELIDEKAASNLATQIQSAILAEREACAKICDDLQSKYVRIEKESKAEQSRLVFRNKAISASSAAFQIRARSNAPEVKCSRGAYGDYDTLPSLIPETEKEITAQMPPKSRQAGVFTPSPAQIIDSKEIVAPGPVSA